jgi:hypothetical protein
MMNFSVRSRGVGVLVRGDMLGGILRCDV